MKDYILTLLKKLTLTFGLFIAGFLGRLAANTSFLGFLPRFFLYRSEARLGDIVWRIVDNSGFFFKTFYDFHITQSHKKIYFATRNRPVLHFFQLI
jgi:hypothetical protein